MTEHHKIENRDKISFSSFVAQPRVTELAMFFSVVQSGALSGRTLIFFTSRGFSGVVPAACKSAAHPASSPTHKRTVFMRENPYYFQAPNTQTARRP
jgi:hypothetical protein